MVHTTYLSLGSNMGDRSQWLNQALNMLTVQAGYISMRSQVYETAAWGITDQPSFLNMAVELRTELTAAALLQSTRYIETTLGRQRTIKWGPRTLDIDILFYDNDIINIPELTVPHPYLQERRFILLPMAEIAPSLIHPTLGKTVSQLLSECEDELEISVFKEM